MVEEEWSFIQKSKYRCKEDERIRLFRYELAREMGVDPFHWASSMKTVFGDYFPDTPYLKIPENERKKLWEKAFSLNNEVPLFDPQEPYGGFDYHCDNSSPSVALITLRLNFDYPDKVLQLGFGQMIAKMRRTKAIYDARKGTGIDDALKQLAATRLLRSQKTPEKAMELLIEHGYDIPYEGGHSGWNKAKNNVSAWTTDPPFLAPSLNSVLPNKSSKKRRSQAREPAS